MFNSKNEMAARMAMGGQKRKKQTIKYIYVSNTTTKKSSGMNEISSNVDRIFVCLF